MRYVQVKDLPNELQAAATRRVRRGLPEPRSSLPSCSHGPEVHATAADGTVWCRACTAEAA